MHHRDHAHGRVTFNEHNRVWESDQQLATNAQVAWKADDGSAFGTGGFERQKRGAQLIPELSAEALSLLFVRSRVRSPLPPPHQPGSVWSSACDTSCQPALNDIPYLATIGISESTACATLELCEPFSIGRKARHQSLRELEALVVGERQRIFEQLAGAVRHSGILAVSGLVANARSACGCRRISRNRYQRTSTSPRRVVEGAT